MDAIQRRKPGRPPSYDEATTNRVVLRLEEGWPWPNQKVIAQELGVSKDFVYRVWQRYKEQRAAVQQHARPELETTPETVRVSSPTDSHDSTVSARRRERSA